MIVVVVVVVIVMIMVMIVIVVMCVVYVIVFQFFCSCFVDGDDFYIKFQVLVSQYVVVINYNVVVFNFSNFYWYWILIGFCQEVYVNLQFINVYEDVFWYMLYQVFVILIVSVVSVDGNVKFVVYFVVIQCVFQVGNQGVVIVQVIQWCVYWRFIN